MSNSQLKPININPELFNIKPKKMKNKTLKREKPTSNLQSSKLKKNLLTKIKNYKQNKNIDNDDNTNITNIEKKIDSYDEASNESIKKQIPNILLKKSIINSNGNSSETNNLLDKEDDYTSSIDYLQKLALKKNKSQKQFINDTEELEDSRENNISLKITNTPQYGCLKNGTLPTYKEWKNTTLKKPTIEINTDNNVEYKSENTKSNNKTLKYYLGKRGRKVSILVKNSSTRKKIATEHNLLKQESIYAMKNYLKKHNLLKSGSHAPQNIIKKMYEDAILSGDINNSNKDNIIHNYLAE